MEKELRKGDMRWEFGLISGKESEGKFGGEAFVFLAIFCC